MLRVSKVTDYGVVLLSRIANSEEQRIHNARELSQHSQVPLPMVSKILKKLAREGILTSHRGTKGGYSLSRSPGEIGLIEMIEALEGPIALTQCVSVSETECERTGFCPMCSSWEMVNRAILEALQGITLETMARSFRKPSVGDAKGNEDGPTQVLLGRHRAHGGGGSRRRVASRDS